MHWRVVQWRQLRETDCERYYLTGIPAYSVMKCAGIVCGVSVNHAMLTATKDETVIFISHSLSTTGLADPIIMLEKGRIVERGTHEQLLQQNGKYAQMWRVQAGAYIQV